ncbi:hypothetical protein M422DRAFT_178335 [Sphaerobolus stellatus SS14]|uniref:Tc1-like transposase DDE domain-containing protein n=1 Tax=Sphaerobolus stellatus (strain SS14) TaxID=990650 RepID=A0A0C9UR33_SPHS4|nr:hypothetical protein M422DRAFT_178335 [Sphaerobolus stellatus SS14]
MEDIGWQEASLLAAQAAGFGKGFARNIHHLVWELLEDPLSKPALKLSGPKSRIHDEDFSRAIQLHLQTLGKKYFSANDIVQFLDQPEVKKQFSLKRAPNEHTVRKWLKFMEYRYGPGKKGMYIDGHEREDVVEYRQNTFLPGWYLVEPRMMKWLGDGTVVPPLLSKFPLEKRVVWLTHDESTFYAHDQRKLQWVHSSEKAETVQKGEGASIMVSDFVCPDLGWLKSKDGTREARLIFKAGKSREGYFTCDDLCRQVELAIELFEDHFPGTATAAFMFDNAPSHQKRAPNALSARYMPKYSKPWWGKKGICRMRAGKLPNGDPQDLHYSDMDPLYPRYFKGMAKILEERGLTKEAQLPAECPKFKCADLNAACCCRHVLFNQADFLAQKPAIIELVESHGHLALFYPKFHPELNFIEQCWGYSKLHYRMLPQPKNEAEMEKNIRECLDRVDLEKIRRYSNRSARFIDAYQRGLSGSQAVWANRKYHGHRMLPEKIMDEIEKAGIQ